MMRSTVFSTLVSVLFLLSLDTLAPLPNLLAYLHWKFTPRWNFVGRVGYFSLDNGA